MDSFKYEALTQRVVFGPGTRRGVGEEVERLGLGRTVVISTPQQRDMAEEISALLGSKCALVLPEAVMHTPVHVTEAALEKISGAGVDCIISVGGGSTTGLGKAIALRTDLPQIVLPTTYAGSEATPILGQTENGRKTTQRTMKVLPEVVIYDVDLSLSLPTGLTVTSGINAIAHAVEALYAQDRNPMVTLFALEGISALVRALPVITRDPSNEAARSDVLYGAWACGTCLGSVTMALHHKACHTLGGSFDLPHSETHTVMLPHAIAYNEKAVPGLLRPAAELLGTPSLAEGLFELAQSLGAPTRLGDIGMPQDGLDAAADMIAATAYWNPRPVECNAIRRMLDDAYYGRMPNLADV